MFKRIQIEIKNEILNKVKNGEAVAEIAKQYAISTKTIYTWLSNESRPEISVLEYNRLKRENEELKRIIGLITLELERGKKNYFHQKQPR
jgi:transposase